MALQHHRGASYRHSNSNGGTQGAESTTSNKVMAWGSHTFHIPYWLSNRTDVAAKYHYFHYWHCSILGSKRHHQVNWMP
eukprot:41177-Ditylum_brightwellii.AAC.1